MAGMRMLGRSYRTTSLGDSFSNRLAVTIRRAGLPMLRTLAIAGAFLLSLLGFILFVQDHGIVAIMMSLAMKRHAEAEPPSHAEEHEWTGRMTFAKITSNVNFANKLELGYKIDSLSAVMFLMVTFIATLISRLFDGVYGG